MGGMSNAAVEAAGAEVERFASSSSRWLGFTGIGVSAVLAVGALASDPAGNRQLILAAFAVAALSWVCLVRPVAAAHQHGLLMRNMVRDVTVPWSQVRRCAVNQTLQVVTDDDVYHGLGVTRSARTIMREQYGRQSMVAGFGSRLISTATETRDDSLRVHQANQEQSGRTYTAYVESRIRDLASEAGSDERTPVVALAVMPVALLVAAAVCLALMLL